MISFSITDVEIMTRALRLARKGLYTTHPNPRVGCVLVKNGEIVGEGWHQKTGEPHAEIYAVQEAGEKARGATAYISLEPCCHQGRTPPCTDALIQAGISEVVVAMTDPNPEVNGQGLQTLAKAGIKTSVGLLQPEAEALNPGFIKRMQSQRPYVRLKQAISLDGRTAMASGESKWISGEAARADVQRLRAQSSAILTGSGTVLADDPSLNVRDLDIGRQPLRVVVDSVLSTPETARILSLEGDTLIVTASGDADRVAKFVKAGAEVLCLPGSVGRVDLSALLQHLAEQHVNEILVEAGSELSGGLLDAGLVDELIIYLSPHIMGNNARGMFNLPAIEKMANRISMQIKDVTAVGDDWRITATPVYKTHD
ncbi:MAG: bifunctional diaminohydroxyphosphoribosylaminopyrimidine deaminase/5-amino-6-(5-phosphoribosylamino)uracil reductase RibD [Acidiferrobacterales bacterium]